MLKIFKVTFNDGGWHSGSLPSFFQVAETKEDAIEIVKSVETHYKGWDCWATEFKIEGYIIKVYDEKSFERNEKIDKIL
jgi:hypothetical protein